MLKISAETRPPLQSRIMWSDRDLMRQVCGHYENRDCNVRRNIAMYSEHDNAKLIKPQLHKYHHSVTISSIHVGFSLL
jgi:hypothetical protein